jgi:hypothetical protein
MYTQQDQIWISLPKEQAIVKQLSDFILSQGFEATRPSAGDNYGCPYIYNKNGVTVSFRFVDSAFFPDPEAWNRLPPSTIITDNIPLTPVAGNLLTALPEFWSIWHFEPEYTDRPATKAFNCFMNRVSGERSVIFYELVKRNILDQGIVSYNCNRPGDAIWENLDKTVCLSNFENEYKQAELFDYESEHQQGLALIPYNTITGSVEQCIIDSNISVVLETYISDSHIVFSEKLFRVLQLPRPWLLYCSSGAVEQLRHHGFDVLDDYVDHSYDKNLHHTPKLLEILDQLETFVDRQYTDNDYARFDQAARHNRNLLKSFEQNWPAKFTAITDAIKNL